MMKDIRKSGTAILSCQLQEQPGIHCIGVYLDNRTLSLEERVHLRAVVRKAFPLSVKILDAFAENTGSDAVIVVRVEDSSTYLKEIDAVSEKIGAILVEKSLVSDFKILSPQLPQRTIKALP